MNATEINSTYIQAEAEREGLRSFDVEAEGGTGENHVTVYTYIDRDGCYGRVAATNGQPVWEDADPGEFLGLLQSVGIEPTFISAAQIGDLPEAREAGVPDREWVAAVVEALNEVLPAADFRAADSYNGGGPCDWVSEDDWLRAIEIADTRLAAGE